MNVKFAESDVLTRDGLADPPAFTAANIVRFFKYNRLGEAGRFIYLDNLGNLYDSLFPSNPIWSDPTFLDFSLTPFNNRVYITPHNRTEGIPNRYVLVYEGSGQARVAAGAQPNGFTLVAANSAAAGNVEMGYHLFAVCFITASGFLTAPGPPTFPIVNAPGGLAVDISSLPIGNQAVSSVVVLATKSIPTTGAAGYTGNQLGYEYFFIPGAVVVNGTTSITVNFYDADLVDSADYLFNNLTAIPAGVGIMSYGNRLAVWGEDANPNTIRFSQPNDPETFDAINGHITIAPDDNSSGIKNAITFRKSLLIFKSNRIKVTLDNGDDPTTWSIDDVDNSAGAECFGVGMILDSRGANNDRVMFASRSGLISYEGLVKRPELTYNIEDYWNRINKAAFNLIQIVDDPEQHKIIVTIPLDDATAISHVLFGDYSMAHTIYGNLDPKLIKWSPWTFPSPPVSVIGDVDPITQNGILQFALASGNIYTMSDENPVKMDYGNSIDSWIRTSLKTAMAGWINHFNAIKLRCTGFGSLQIDVYGEDSSRHQSLLSLPLSPSPGYEPYRLMNFINEKMSVRLRTSFSDEYFKLSQLYVWAREIYLSRPN
jgi:hypothetical protein